MVGPSGRIRLETSPRPGLHHQGQVSLFNVIIPPSPNLTHAYDIHDLDSNIKDKLVS